MKWIGCSLLAVCLAGAGWAKPPVPRPADDFHVVDSHGKVLSLGAYRGKVVLVQFLYTTCPHCQATARMLSGLENELGPRGLQILGAAFNPEAQAQPAVLDEFVRNNAVTFPVGAAPAEKVLGFLGISVMERYVVPMIMIVDRRGTIRAQSEFSGSAELQNPAYLTAFLNGLLKESTR